MLNRPRAAWMFLGFVATAVAVAAAVPTRPAVGKAAIDLLICAVPVAVWLRVDRPGWLRHERRRLGQCPACGYDLTGNASGVCPECGVAAPAPSGGRSAGA